VLTVGASAVLLNSDINSTVQAHYANLDAIGSLAFLGGTNSVPYMTSTGVFNTAPIGTTGFALLAAATAAAGRTALSLATIASSGSASDLTTGTLPDAVLTGAYTGITSLNMNGTLTNSVAGGTDNFILNGSTSNWIKWSGVGSGIPTLTTHSVGTKLLLRDTVSATIVDTAIGVSSLGAVGSMWFSVTNTARQYDWYAGTTSLMTLLGTGTLSVGGSNVLLASGIGSISQAWSGTLDNLAALPTTGATPSVVVQTGFAFSSQALSNFALLASGNVFTTGQTIQSSAAGSVTAGPVLILARASAAGAATNALGSLRFQGVDSAGATQNYAQILSTIVDPVSATAEGRLRFDTVVGGAVLSAKLYIGNGIYTVSRSDQGQNTINANTLYESDVSLASKYGQLAVNNTWTAATQTYAATTAASATPSPVLQLFRNSATVAVNNATGGINFQGQVAALSGANTYARALGIITDLTAGAESGVFRVQTQQAGSLLNRLSVGLGLFTIGESDQGLNTINATTLYEGGTSLPAKYSQIDTPDSGDLFRILSGGVSGTDVNTAQQWFPTTGSVTVASSTMYYMEGVLYLTRAAGSVSHTISLIMGGTSTMSSIAYMVDATSSTGNVLTASNVIYATSTAAVVVTAASTSTTENNVIRVKGIVRVNGGGSFIPQFRYSAAPGGAPTILANSFIRLTKIGTNVAVSNGTWA
jgi:hypothetical protein